MQTVGVPRKGGHAVDVRVLPCCHLFRQERHPERMRGFHAVQPRRSVHLRRIADPDGLGDVRSAFYPWEEEA